MNPGAESFTILLQKGPNDPWGFRLQGGADFATPLSVQSVTPQSIAERHGMRAGDAVLQVNGKPTEYMSHDDAKGEIMNAGNQCTFLLQRGAVSIWRPQVTQLQNLRPDEIPTFQDDGGEPLVQRTSLAANKQVSMNIGSGHNRAAKGWFGGGGASQPQQTSPQQQFHIQGQSQSHLGQGYQTGHPQGGLAGGAPQRQGYTTASSDFQQQGQFIGGAGGTPVGETERTAGTRSVMAPVSKPASERRQAQHFTCKGCGSLVTGVFVKVAGDPYHPECFKCARCGKNLKQQGYFEDGGQLICDNCR